MKRLLVVEDDSDMAQSLADIFEVKGYSVRVAYDGARGWEAIMKEIPDAVVSDVNMPEMNGYQLLERVRSCNSTSTLPFVLLTARSERENIRQGMTSGADDYVTKPFAAKEIIDSVESILNRQDKFLEKQETTLRLLRKNISYALPHELRTPLQSILGYNHMMMSEYETLSREEFKMMSETAFQAGTRLQRLIENTIAYAQLEIIASDPEQQRQLRNNILSDPVKVIEQCARQVADRHQRLSDLTLKLDNKVLRMSRENLRRIVEELVDNAFKFSDAGTPVVIRSDATEDGYTLKILDRGRGITREQREQVGAYMQFERLLHEQQGLGMGLITAKKLVELHAGTFTIKSKMDEGTGIIIQMK